MPSANDNFANRITLSGASGSTTVDVTGNTMETGEPTLSGTMGRSAWFTFTPSGDGVLRVDTNGTTAVTDTVLGVHTGASVTALTEVGRDDDSGTGALSSLEIAVTGGVAYHVQVGTYGGSGQGVVVVNWSHLVPVGTQRFPATSIVLAQTTGGNPLTVVGGSTALQTNDGATSYIDMPGGGVIGGGSVKADTTTLSPPGSVIGANAILAFDLTTVRTRGWVAEIDYIFRRTAGGEVEIATVGSSAEVPGDNYVEVSLPFIKASNSSWDDLLQDGAHTISFGSDPGVFAFSWRFSSDADISDTRISHAAIELVIGATPGGQPLLRVVSADASQIWRVTATENPDGGILRLVEADGTRWVQDTAGTRPLVLIDESGVERITLPMSLEP